MATVTGLTAARMLEIEAQSVVSGAVLLDRLILTRHDGTTIDAGNVKGDKGDDAAPGSVEPVPNTTPIRTDDSRVKTADPEEPNDAVSKAHLDSLITGIELAGGVNLDTITTAGTYTQTLTAEAASGTNYPAGIAGVLEVSATNTANMVWQTYTPYGVNATVVYKRARYNGVWTDWLKFNADPPGQITMFAAATVPSGWLLCNGAAVSRTTYKDLFDTIGTTYGVGDNSTTFNVPNLKGRVPVGLDSAQTEFNTMAKLGGAKTHTLTTAEMPAHTHTTKIRTNVLYGPGAGSSNYGVDASGTDPTSSTGGGGAHNNLQPYIVMNYIIKI